MGGERTKGLLLCRTAWDGMDACTRCGEAIPVVWARNTDDPSGHHTHSHIHTRTHAHTHLAHLTQQTDHPADHGAQSPEPRRTTTTRPRRQTLLHLGGLNREITPTDIIHQSPPTPPSTRRRQPAAAPATRYHCHEMALT